MGEFLAPMEEQEAVFATEDSPLVNEAGAPGADPPASKKANKQFK